MLLTAVENFPSFFCYNFAHIFKGMSLLILSYIVYFIVPAIGYKNKKPSTVSIPSRLYIIFMQFSNIFH